MTSTRRTSRWWCWPLAVLFLCLPGFQAAQARSHTFSGEPDDIGVLPDSLIIISTDGDLWALGFPQAGVRWICQGEPDDIDVIAPPPETLLVVTSDRSLGATNGRVLKITCPKGAGGENTLQYSLPGECLLSARLFDCSDRLLRDAMPSGGLPAGWRVVTWDVSHLSKGAYFLRWQTDKAVGALKLVVRR
jgi:hypothetical protein